MVGAGDMQASRGSWWVREKVRGCLIMTLIRCAGFDLRDLIYALGSCEFCCRSTAVLWSEIGGLLLVFGGR